MILGFDTATPATAVALMRDGAEPLTARHDPAPGDRPGHASQLLPLADGLLRAAGAAFADVGRVAVGTGPGTFTGLRIGIATARALARASGAALRGVPTLEALADGAGHRAVLAVLDARRGEAFVAGYVDGVEVFAPAAVPPDALAGLPLPAAGGPWVAVGDGAVRFGEVLREAGCVVPPAGSSRHRVDAAALCRLARDRPPQPPEAVMPQYIRPPDARPRVPESGERERGR